VPVGWPPLRPIRIIAKRVAILPVACGSTWALDSLKEVRRTMSAKILEPASGLVPLGSNQIDENVILARDELRRLLAGSVESLVNALN